VLLRDRLLTFNTQYAVWFMGLVVFSWYDVISCESSVHTFIRFFYNILIFDVPQYSHIFHYIKGIRPAIYFDNQKIIAYHL